MTTKKKIIISVTAAVLVIAVAIVGVLAAQTTSVGITNTVTFNATSVNATVEVSAKYAKCNRQADGIAVSDYTTSDGAITTSDALSSAGFAGGSTTYTFEQTATETRDAVFDDIELTSAWDTVIYTIYITNDGSKPFAITLSEAVNNALWTAGSDYSATPNTAYNLVVDAAYAKGANKAAVDAAFTGGTQTAQTIHGNNNAVAGTNSTKLAYSEVVRVDITVHVYDLTKDVASPNFAWTFNLDSTTGA